MASSLEDDINALADVAGWIEVKPHWNGSRRSGWTVVLRSFNDLFGIEAMIIRDTVSEAVAEALRGAQERSKISPAADTSSTPRKKLRLR